MPMKRLLILAIPLLAASLLLVSVGARAQQLNTLDAATVPAAPKTRTDDVKDIVQGVEITDPYRWLEDQNSPETRAWIDAQNAYTDSQLTKLPGRTELKQLLSGLINNDALSTPVTRNHRYFFLKFKAGQDQSVLCLRKGLGGKDEVLIDPMAMSADHSITVRLNAVSRDGMLLVYSLREGGADERTPHLFDVEARKDLPDHFPNAVYDDIALMPDKSGLYYARRTAEGPRVFFHKIGTDPADDLEVFGKGDGLDKFIGLDVPEDGRYLALQVSHGTSGSVEVYFQDLKKKGPIVPIVNDLDAKFYEEILGNRMFLRTNWKAPKWRIVEVDLRNPAQNHWRETLPEGEAVLDGFSVVGGKLAVRFLQNIVWQVKIFEPSGKFVREITPPALGTVSGLSGSSESNEGFFTFTSYHIPQTIYRYDMATGKQEIWSQRKVPFDSSKYEVEQVWYNSKDGTKVPMVLAHAKGLTLNGSNPVLLSGYGGFNQTYRPAYGSYVAAWLASGGVYAFAHVRGGGEFGEEWHRAGMFEKKQNVFDDFIAAAEWLIQKNYTSPSRLAISGGSNGGLLVGAALTQRPDLFAAVVCDYPLLDMVRYHMFLRAKPWVSEYGSSEDPGQFKYIYAYSPYHHVQQGTKYPAVLLNTGDGDTRVAPLHARKMTALLQAATSSGRPILLHYETKSGHSGGTPISKVIDDDANELSFLFWQLGVHPGSAPASVAKVGP